MSEGLIGTVCGDNRVNFNFAAETCTGIYSATESINRAAKKIRNPTGVVKPHRILIINPLQRHPRRICPEYLLR